MSWTVYGWSQVECSVLAISKRGFVSPVCCSLINTFFWWNVCIYRVSQQSICFPFWHFLISFKVSSFVPYSCLLFKMCAAYAEVGLFDLIYLMCSLNLMPVALPDCPTYTLLHVLHFSSYKPLGSSCVCLAFSCCCIVLVAQKAIFKSVCLNRLDIFLTNGLKYVNVTHLFRRVVVSCCCCCCYCVQFCLSAVFLFVNFVFNWCIRAGG